MRIQSTLPRSASHSPLRPLSRLFWVAVNLGAGLLPSLAFFIWMERNASLPVVGGERLLPALLPSSYLAYAFPDFSEFTLRGLSFLWDLSLILLFGLIHSVTAQNFFLKRLEAWVPLQAQRTIYLAITGTTAVGVMGLWQNTGSVLWSLPLRPLLLQLLSLLLFWSFVLLGLIGTRGLDLWTFLGLKPIYSTVAQIQEEEARQELWTHGLYQYVRHPIYLFTLCALWLTPIMTLDRMAIALGVTLDLLWGIPVEEEKLLARFGDRYRDYRKSTPALFPKRHSN